MKGMKNDKHVNLEFVRLLNSGVIRVVVQVRFLESTCASVTMDLYEPLGDQKNVVDAPPDADKPMMPPMEAKKKKSEGKSDYP
ncbi:hypothetical protein Q1695_012493 [Nippostrongylus brasiliensis]|nr:hypothetical protein Q1695_012493 [Nippostrongylus brasiliensis]